MNIITGQRENVVLVPTRGLLVDQALVVKGGVVQARTVQVGYRNARLRGGDLRFSGRRARDRL
jgi:hypothetical protein